MKGILTLVGAGLTLVSGASQYAEFRETGVRTPAQAAIATLTGYDQVGGVNDVKTVGMRLTNTWGPLAAGAVGSKIASRSGINKSLPKGINL